MRGLFRRTAHPLRTRTKGSVHLAARGTNDLEAMGETLVRLGRSYVQDRGLAGTRDWKVIDHVVAKDFTMVTNKSVKPRGNRLASSLWTMLP